MPHPLWQSAPYGSCRMPPASANGKFPCVLKYYLMQCGRCDKPQPTCMYRQQPREQDAAVLQETRDSDPHYKEFEEALKNLGGSGQGFTTPPGESPSRAQRASQRASRRVGGSAALEQRMDVITDTLTELLNQAKAPAIRKVRKAPKTQASSSEESASEAESEEVSSDESVDPHKARPLPPTSIAGSRQSSKSSKTSASGKKKAIRMMSFQAKKEV